MGLIGLDDVVGFAIGKVEDKLEGEEKQEKTSFGGALLRFVVSTIWVFVTLVASMAAFMGMYFGTIGKFLGDERGKVLCYLAVGLCLVIFLLTFFIPYLRKKGSLTRWCGIICLGDALWWIYILVSGF